MSKSKQILKIQIKIWGLVPTQSDTYRIQTITVIKNHLKQRGQHHISI
jgi:hypothetical protein